MKGKKEEAMSERRKKPQSINIPTRFKVIRLVLLLVILFTFLNCYTSITMLGRGNIVYGGEIAFFAFQLSFVAVIVILVITLIYVLHYGFGSLSRMEKCLWAGNPLS